MSKIDSIACTTAYDEFSTVIDVFKCENRGRKVVEQMSVCVAGSR